MAFLILREQLAILERDVAITEFERDVLARIERRSPRYFTVVPDRALAEVVRLGVERAVRYGLTRTGPVRVFVEMMIAFGCAFDTDPLLPWAATALREPCSTELGKAERLHDAMTAYREAVAGPGKDARLSALRRFDALATECLASPLPGGDLEGAAEERVRALLPERFAYVGPSGARAAVRAHLEAAASFGIREGAEAAVFSMLASLLGHGFVRDPLFPWALVLAADPAPQDRVRQAVREAAAHARRMLKLVERE